ncbi:hypothetical protein IMG5_173800 [Ichthyophthirius multifiliis]|uniref:SOUL heme-binding protein n=1 Tax=Ichthyophthirius multifiliis TaxID=5932 RepID=G0R1Z9_ICHMU|nr:hypothetical protein IMG5_173800 [Ichthyophthirius multifiliis]EGR28524.1 hypothetical protein IMG5_173800 [Ichthyophthirius multifiliis]|eukprot:XP_004029760.1 hypothetical protein IMG5_173800 [Ichthyophthirius multifiliis]
MSQVLGCIGQIFGFNGSKEPQFQLLKQQPYQIRKIQSYIIAKVQIKNKNENQAFRILANYIGAFGKPFNTKSKSLAMTAPVLKEPIKIQMTTPVLNQNEFLSFVLPFEYSQIDQVPEPNDKEIVFEKVDEQVVAVCQFSGITNDKIFKSKLEELYKQIKNDRFINEEENIEQLNYQFARYNPPFCIPFMRRNEVWIILNEQKVNSIIIQKE